MLEIKNLTKKYGELAALSDFTFTFDKGVYGLLGANGAGKSTLLNLITDNIKRTDGEILYNGTDILTLGASFRSKVGYTPQLQGMYEDFSARQFLHYIGSLKGMKARECKEQTELFLEIVGLLHAAHKKLGSYSGGMRQRVLLAAAMLDNPEILILDEPTAGLDPEERIRLRNYISEISRERTVLLATHVVSDIESIAGSVIVLSRGKILVSGSPSELVSGIRGKISVLTGSYKEVSVHKEKYPKGQVSLCGDKYRLRIVEDEVPEGFTQTDDNADLEDVYLYYTEGRL